MFKLVIEDDEGNKTVVPVIRDEISIGRQEGNTIRLTERNVSRRHAKLVKEEENLFVEEVSARYGTRKNGERIEGRARFDVGDVFLIGDYRLSLEGDTPKAEEKPAPAAAPPKPEDRKPNPFTNAPTQITHRDDIEKRASQGTEILPAQPAKIVVISSNFAGQEFPLNRKEMVIGRSDECDIIIDHRSVSQTHAKIAREPAGNYKIVDLNSKNGVKVSDEQYRAVHLKRGDVIELGHVKFRFVEPGENYVFTPHIGEEFEKPSSGSKTGLIVMLVVFLGIVVVGGGVMLMDSEGTQAATEKETAKAKTVADEDQPKKEKPESDKPDEWVASQIEKAQSEMGSGSPERASVLLEATRDYPSASAAQREKIDEMLSLARRERPLEAELEQGRAAYDKGQYAEALEHFKKIPPSDESPIYEILEREGLADQAIEKLVSQANAAAREKEFDAAEGLLDEVLLYDDENADALALQEMIEESKKKAVASKSSRPKRNPAPKKARPARKDPQEAIAAAQSALLSGDNAGAIKNCKGVRNAKCYRILGVAYKKTGDIERSCKYFERAGLQPDHCK